MRPRLYSLCAALLLSVAGDPPAAGARPARPVIQFMCPEIPGLGRQDPGQALCTALSAALSEAAPGHVVSHLRPGETRALRPGDLSVALTLAPGSAHLRWQAAEAAGTGMPVTRADSGAQSAASLARALLQASPGLRALLQPAARGAFDKGDL